MISRSSGLTSYPLRSTLSRVAWCGAFVLVWLGMVQPASAEFFTFNTTPSSQSTTVGGVTVTLNQKSVSDPNVITLSAISPGTDIVFGDITVTGVTRFTTLQNINFNYMFHVALSNYLLDSDVVSNGAPVSFDVSGSLGGTVGPGNKANITNTFSQVSIVHTVGGEPYVMNLFSYVPPGLVNAGAFGAHVTVVPEPSTMVLLGLGVLALATPAYRRWRRNSPRRSGFE